MKTVRIRFIDEKYPDVTIKHSTKQWEPGNGETLLKVYTENGLQAFQIAEIRTYSFEQE